MGHGFQGTLKCGAGWVAKHLAPTACLKGETSESGAKEQSGRPGHGKSKVPASALELSKIVAVDSLGSLTNRFKSLLKGKSLQRGSDYTTSISTLGSSITSSSPSSTFQPSSGTGEQVLDSFSQSSCDSQLSSSAGSPVRSASSSALEVSGSPPPPPYWSIAASPPPQSLSHGSYASMGARLKQKHFATTTHDPAGTGLASAFGLKGDLTMHVLCGGQHGSEAAAFAAPRFARALEGAAAQLLSEGMVVTQEAALRLAFEEMEQALLWGGAAATSGTSMLVSLFAAAERTCTVATVGNCRAVKVSVDAEGDLVTTALTRDHHPARNAAEYRRLYAVQAWDEVYGNEFDDQTISWDTAADEEIRLRTSRALGFAQLKYEGSSLLAKPTISVHSWDDNDQFVMMGTDGVWANLQPERAGSMVWEELAAGGDGAEQRAARLLVEAAHANQAVAGNALGLVVRLAPVLTQHSGFSAGPVVHRRKDVQAYWQWVGEGPEPHTLGGPGWEMVDEQCGEDGLPYMGPCPMDWGHLSELPRRELIVW